MKRLVLIDGHAIIHRAYHAYPSSLITSKGELVNAVYGFTSILLTVLRKICPEYVAIAFDKKGPTFRHQQYTQYKASRPKMDKELEDQIERVHQVVKVLNIPFFEMDGFEADDVIGTLARQARKDVEVLIVTPDQDAMQLVRSNVKVFVPARGKKPAQIFDRKAVLKKYGIKPKQIIDLKALAGDPSDEIPGVRGIGPKTAGQLIREFGSMEKVYEAIEKKKKAAALLKDRVLKVLAEGAESAVLSKSLATIVTNVPINLVLKKCLLLDYDEKKIIKLFEELEFKSLLKRLPKESWEELGKEKNIKKEKPKKKEKQMGLFS